MTQPQLQAVYVWAILVLTSLCLPMRTTAGDVGSSVSESQLPTGFERRDFVDENGEEHCYHVYVPQQQPADLGWPVVLFLHGAGEKGTDGIRPLSAGLGTAIEKFGEQPFLAVFPQCENLTGRHLTGWYAESSDAQRALAILKQVEREFPVDPQQRVLCGWSMGGYGAWSLAATYPEMWSGVLAMSGGQTETPLDLSRLAQLQTPVWAIHGREDSLIPHTQSEFLIERLNQLGGRGAVTVVDGVGHDVWRYALASPHVLNWLSKPSIKSVTNAKDFTSRTPLPRRSQFYVQHYTQVREIRDAVSLRLGNDALQVISAGLPSLIPQASLEGSLQDIERQIGGAGQQATVRFEGLTYRSRITQTSLRGISSGRFEVVFSIDPLFLDVERTVIRNGETTARSGPLTITIGHREAIPLALELQPVIHHQGLKLNVLRTRFEIPDHNWYITPPSEIELDSSIYTKEHIQTGIVGGIYLQKSELEQAVLDVVPGLVGVVENELKSREVPKLARILWPLPALVPTLNISPSQIRTDAQGLSMVFDMQVRTPLDRTGDATPPGLLSSPFDVTELPNSRDLRFGVALEAIERLGSLAIQSELAYVNILDIPSEELHSLQNREFLRTIFPASVDENDVAWDVGLRMLAPFVVRAVEEETREVIIEILAPRVRFEAIDRQTRKRKELLFSIRQRIQIDTRKTNGVPTSLVTHWLPDPQVDVLEDSETGRAQAEQFETAFCDAWTQWSLSQSSEPRAIPRLQFGTAALTLRTFEVGQGVARLSFDAATVHEGSTAAKD